MSVRPLGPEDAPAYRATMLEAYALHPDAFTSSAAERRTQPLAWWYSRLTDAQSLVLGAFGDGQLAGVAGLSFDSREKVRHKARLFGMYVAAPHRRRHYGQQLVEEALRQARMRPGIKVIQLTVTHGNEAAEGLYRKCGFTAFGVEPFAVAVEDGFMAKVHLWCAVK